MTDNEETTDETTTTAESPKVWTIGDLDYYT